MKIHSKDFRVREGCEVNLKKWPTKVDPVYKGLYPDSFLKNRNDRDSPCLEVGHAI